MIRDGAEPWLETAALPARWRRTPQEEFREQVRTMRRLHTTAMSDDDQVKRLHARSQWFDEVQITLEQLAEQPTVWRGINEPPKTLWEAMLGLTTSDSKLVWFILGLLAFSVATGLVKLPNPFAG